MMLSKLIAKRGPNSIWFTAFVGFNLLQSSLTKFCPLEIAL